jgi:hypothetical protein
MTRQILHNAIPHSLCLAAESAWPSPDWPYWHRYNGATANKFGSIDRNRIPPACLAALDALALTVAPYIGDSFIDYDLHAAGMHMMPPGGFLSRHLDAECHPIRRWRRTHSIVMALNETFGGNLILEGIGEFAPKPGRAIVFDTPGQWHEVTQVADNSPYRKTLALFAWQQISGDCDGAKSATFQNQVKS